MAHWVAVYPLVKAYIAILRMRNQSALKGDEWTIIVLAVVNKKTSLARDNITTVCFLIMILPPKNLPIESKTLNIRLTTIESHASFLDLSPSLVAVKLKPATRKHPGKTTNVTVKTSQRDRRNAYVFPQLTLN